jgi:hypothetical protein
VLEPGVVYREEPRAARCEWETAIEKVNEARKGLARATKRLAEADEEERRCRHELARIERLYEKQNRERERRGEPRWP